MITTINFSPLLKARKSELIVFDKPRFRHSSKLSVVLQK